MTSDAVDERKPAGADIAGTVLLILLHVFMYVFTAGFIAFGAMLTDSCAYVECGAEAWVSRGIGLMWFGGAALLLGSVCTCVWRLIKGRRAVLAALVCCGLHVLLALVAFSMVSQAGPTGA